MHEKKLVEGHSREDFPERDDENYLKHTMSTLSHDKKVTITYDPVDVSKWEPKTKNILVLGEDMKVILKIKRFDPKANIKTSYSAYTLEVENTSRVIDALETIAKTQDRTLSFRRSCAHGVCGSDAMIINGKNRLACKTLFKQVANEENNFIVEIQPLNHLEVKKDLVVDQQPFINRYKISKALFYTTNRSPCNRRIFAKF